MTASNQPETKEIADKLHELMVHHPDTSYDEFVTHVNNKMTRSLNSKSASNHKAKKLVSSEQSEPAYAALKPPPRTRNGSPAFRDTDSVTSARSGKSTISKTNYIGSYKHLVCKDCGHRGHNSMKYMAHVQLTKIQTQDRTANNHHRHLSQHTSNLLVE